MVFRTEGVRGKCWGPREEIPFGLEPVHIPQELIFELGKQVIGMAKHAGLTRKFMGDGIALQPT